MQKMKGKRVLVTGSGTGIGQGIALEFARDGADVALHYAQSTGSAAKTVEMIEALGGKVAAFKADLRDILQLRELACEAEKFLGGLDVLVNNAGITMNLPIEQITPEQFDTIYHVNVRAQLFMIQALLPALLHSRGVVINLTSIHALEGYAEHAVYAGSKGAIVAHTRQLAIELAPRGVRVNAIAPGAVPVDNHYKLAGVTDTAAADREGGKGIPCGFVGKPADIGRIAVFLASEDARFIVGQTLIADGGTTSWMPFGEGYKQRMAVRFGKGYVPGL